MNKKMIKKGLTCIVTLIILSAFLTGCNLGGPEGNPSGGGELFFNGAFNNGSGGIQLFVGGPPLSSYRTLARALNEGSELYAHVEHEGLKLRLEGAYDYKSDGFVLSTRTDDRVYSIFGQLDYNGDFQFAEISVTVKEQDEWKMRSHLIEPDPSVILSDDGFSTGLGGVSSGLAGNIDMWIPWFEEDENFREWAMISPAAMVTYRLDPEKGYPEERDRWNFIDYEAEGNEANVITMWSQPTYDSLEAAFPAIFDGKIDSHGNDNWYDAMLSAELNKPIAKWGDLDRYYDKNIFNAIGTSYIQERKTAIAAAFAERWAPGYAVWWFDKNIIGIELWDEWLDNHEADMDDPDAWWVEYDPDWNRVTYFAQAHANGEVFTVDSVNYKVMWDWSFRNKPFNTWRDNLTQTQWENIQNSTGKVFYDYIWKFCRHLTSFAYEEAFLLSKNVEYSRSYQRYRIGKDVYGPTQKVMGTKEDPDDSVSWTESFSEALTFTKVIVWGDGGRDHEGGFNPGMGDGRIFGEGKFDVKFSDVLSGLSGSPAAGFEGKTMSEVFVMLNNNNITSFEELQDAIKEYINARVLDEETANEIQNVNVRIADTNSPNYSLYPHQYSYSIYPDPDLPYPEKAGLRNSTKVRPTLVILAFYTKITWPEWWNPDAPGKITETVTKTLMQVLAEIGPGFGFDEAARDSYNFEDINLDEIETWGGLALAMGYFNGGGDPMPNIMELTYKIDQYPNNMTKPAGAKFATLAYDDILSGVYKNGERVMNMSNDLSGGTSFDSDEYTIKITYSRQAQEGVDY